MGKVLCGKKRMDITMSNELKKVRELQTALHFSSAIGNVQGAAGSYVLCN